MPEKTVLFPFFSFIEVLSGPGKLNSVPHMGTTNSVVILHLRGAQFHTLRSALQKCSVLSVVPGAEGSCAWINAAYFQIL